MGFFILLSLIPVFAAFIYASIQLFILLIHKQLTLKMIVQGLLLSAILHILVFSSFLLNETYYVFTPIFRQVFVFSILPFAVYMPLELSSNPAKKKIAKTILVCIFFSIILAGVFMFYYDDWLNFFGVTSHY